MDDIPEVVVAKFPGVNRGLIDEIEESRDSRDFGLRDDDGVAISVDDDKESRDSREVELGAGDGVTVSVDEVPFTTNRFICLG